MKKPRIGFIILNYMTFNLTIKCLNDLNSVQYDNYFVVVVDNNSSNDSYQKIKNHIINRDFRYEIDLVASDKNGGYSYGNNLGLKFAKDKGADFYIIMNNDVEFQNTHFLLDLANFLNENPNVHIVGPGIIESDDKLELPHRVKRIKPLPYILENLFYPVTKYIENIKKRRFQKNSKLRNVYSVHGCCFIIKADLFEDILYFDDNVFLYGEEIIIGEKLYKRNIDVYYNPYLKIYHKHSSTISSFYNTSNALKIQLESHIHYFTNYRQDIPGYLVNLIIFSQVIKNNVYLPSVFYFKKIVNKLF